MEILERRIQLACLNALLIEVEALVEGLVTSPACGTAMLVGDTSQANSTACNEYPSLAIN
jgi:hypothetical protein